MEQVKSIKLVWYERFLMDTILPLVVEENHPVCFEVRYMDWVNDSPVAFEDRWAVDFRFEGSKLRHTFASSLSKIEAQHLVDAGNESLGNLLSTTNDSKVKPHERA